MEIKFLFKTQKIPSKYNTSKATTVYKNALGMIQFLKNSFDSGMQSSLNRGIGTTALCLLYASLVISSLFLPPLVIDKLDCRKSLTLSILSFAVYTLGKSQVSVNFLF